MPHKGLLGETLQAKVNTCRYWGDVVRWGEVHKQPSAVECCKACRNYVPQHAEDPTCNGATRPAILSHCKQLRIELS